MIDYRELTTFKQRVWDYYHANKRSFPWRETTDIYFILVSELMLQQTQTDRVVPKYTAFMQIFPTVASLASASLTEVLGMWQGLGYNRRALFLKRLSEEVVGYHSGVVPETVAKLDALPGIGYATACAILTYSRNIPTVFIETNVRTVFIHSFYPDQTEVKDADIEPLVAAAVDNENPREWYYALTDYGVMLKKNVPNPNRKSAHYVKQSSFLGSDRKIRGEIVRLLLDKPSWTVDDLYASTGTDYARLGKILKGMTKDGLVQSDGTYFRIFENAKKN
ncbi:MAG: A/G-specific adenine glycosylase [bacterium]|nr:A/G-specific adenine glycosylase [bacterium]